MQDSAQGAPISCMCPKNKLIKLYIYLALCSCFASYSLIHRPRGLVSVGLSTGHVRAFRFLWGLGMTIRRIPNELRTLPEWEKETRAETRADLS